MPDLPSTRLGGLLCGSAEREAGADEKIGAGTGARKGASLFLFAEDETPGGRGVAGM
jgi:hypothetical protein